MASVTVRGVLSTSAKGEPVNSKLPRMSSVKVKEEGISLAPEIIIGESLTAVRLITRLALAPNAPSLTVTTYVVLERALARLDEQSRALVLLKDYEGYSYDEIAEITDLSESQVKVYLHRARKTLKEYLVSVEKII